MPAYYMSESMLNIKDRTVNKTDIVLILMELVVCWRI